MMDPITKCPICDTSLHNPLKEPELIKKLPKFKITCDTCGKFTIAVNELLNLQANQEFSAKKHLLSGSIRHKTEQGKDVNLNSEIIQELINSSNPPQDPLAAVDMLLEYIKSKTRYYGDNIRIDSFDRSITYSLNYQEFENYIFLAKEIDLIKRESGTKSAALTHKGWERVQELKKIRPNSSQVFVAMWFDEKTNTAWEKGLKQAIIDTGYNPIKIDLLEHNQKIDDLIIAEIRKSKFLIADFTGHRGGVYFEAGFAFGLGLPVIWTCKKGDEKDIHFDTRQYNHIIWESPQDLYNKLKNRIEATIIK